MPATALRRPVTVEIEDITMLAHFPDLAAAAAALWESLRALPLGNVQYEAYREFLGAGVVERIEEFLQRDGELTLSFAMAGRSHAVWVRPEATPVRAR